ncbi:hypothetical protein PSEUBRA_002337 [Kalmanozyma brasiliensis GHG001]|uniref:Vacuolar protein sorting-associated protein 51 homolog n=1 Tax=Kalmanozyma brasiliensis (strain GHG001) TaxID=1365824 RepID=V5ECS2_KALBG|nr:uncharacterized protein PSEUBRA_002337 [Kalmanozyma brasiliensis GHG001]EST08246.1 hypothetical protein PSEUBRA_002337 [Kalmanozyma brasiliensis GHG001]
MASTSTPSTPTLASRPLQGRNVVEMSPSSSTGSRPRADKRRASKLRDYYGLSSETPTTSQPSTPIIGESSSIALGPKIDLSSLLRSGSLSTLLGKESELIVQIRELDGERQSLVYNHHHELVAASDTIRNMKIKSESLDPSLDSLRSSFESMSNLASNLEVLRSSARAKAVEESATGGIDRLHDLDPIVTLPARLSDLIECRLDAAETGEQSAEARKMGLAQAEHLWGTMEPVLAAWTDAGVSGVREIAAECRSLLKDGRKAVGTSSASR